MMRLSDAIADKLKGVRSDVEVCKILADNGVNVEEFEKTLSEEELAQVGGGFQKGVAEVHCTNPNCLEALPRTSPINSLCPFSPMPITIAAVRAERISRCRNSARCLLGILTSRKQMFIKSEKDISLFYARKSTDKAEII